MPELEERDPPLHNLSDEAFYRSLGLYSKPYDNPSNGQVSGTQYSDLAEERFTLVVVSIISYSQNSKHSHYYTKTSDSDRNSLSAVCHPEDTVDAHGFISETNHAYQLGSDEQVSLAL